MKLILTREVAGLGNAGDVVTVKDGYGRNFLLPDARQGRNRPQLLGPPIVIILTPPGPPDDRKNFAENFPKKFSG